MKTNQLKAGVYLSYISLFLTNVTSLILTPFIVRNLGQSEYGLYMLIGAFVGYIAVLDFGLGNATVRFVSKYRAENDKEGQENFLASTFIMYGVISALVLLIGLLVYFNLGSIFGQSLTKEEIETASIMFIILIINLALTLPINSFTGIINAYERFIFPRSLKIIRISVRVVLIFILLNMGYKAIAIVLVDALLNLAMMIITMIYVFFKLKVRIKLHQFSKELFKEIFSYSSLIFLSVVVDQIYWRIGHLVLGIVSSTSEVAIFAIGLLFVHYYMTMATSISSVFLPRITKMVVNDVSNWELTKLLIKTGRIQFMVLAMVLGGFVLFGNKFIFLWLGSGYEKSWIVALFAMIPLTIVLTQTIGISILQARNLHGFRALVYLAVSVLNLFISVMLANKMGSVGAIIGTTLSLVIGNIIIMNIYYSKKVGLDMITFYKELCKGLLPSFVIILLLSSLLLLISTQSWLVLMLQCIIYCIVYGFVMWKIGMNSFEKELILKEMKKIGRRI